MKKKLYKAYETDASQVKGKALEVVHPKNIMEVKKFVLSRERLVPRGGGTGLAGGAVPLEGKDTVLDLSKMNHIGKYDKDRKTIEVDAGVILDDLQDRLGKYRLEFPVNPSSHAVATIGGMIATNAVGSRAIKYGRTSDWVRWIEVIDSQGNLERKGVTEIADYAGMEGITGVIVRACLKLAPKRERTASLVNVSSLGEIVEIIRNLKRNSNVSMIEFIDSWISEKIGFGEGYHLVIEYEDGSGILQGQDYIDLMASRDNIYPVLSGEGYIRIEDPKIMIDKFVTLMRWIENKKVPCFGHLSVGILHPCFNEEQEKFIPEMIKLVKRLGGKVTGEHGIGILKKEFVEENDRKILRNIKKRTDVKNKFNVGKLI